MTPDEFDRLQSILAALEPECKLMGQASANFVQDQLQRVEQYGINVRVSPKQMAWLEDLYGKYVGPVEGLDSSSGTPLPDEDDEPDPDEIPF